MSKRCCAKMCFNSQLTNKNISYFGFPKYDNYATNWAIAAGREDLLEKKIDNIIKYFLCAEHFTDDCFVDPPHNTRLKKILRPNVILPIPTIFKCNIDKYIPTNNKNSSKQSDIENDIYQSNDANCPNITDSICLLNNVANDTDLPDIYNINVDTLVEDHSFANIDTYDGLDDSYDMNFIIEEDCNTFESASHQSDDTVQQSDKEVFVCRLCAVLYLSDDICKISRIVGLNDKLNRLLPDMIQNNDNLPQFICNGCLDKVNNCIKTIDDFRSIQLDFRNSYGIE